MCSNARILFQECLLLYKIFLYLTQKHFIALAENFKQFLSYLSPLSNSFKIHPPSLHKQPCLLILLKTYHSGLICAANIFSHVQPSNGYGEFPGDTLFQRITLLFYFYKYEQFSFVYIFLFSALWSDQLWVCVLIIIYWQ